MPRLTSDPSYRVDVSLTDLLKYVKDLVEHEHLDIDPDFQRGHVWNQEQRVRWVEYLLKSGRPHPNHPILLNHPNWMGSSSKYADFVLVDGKQRLTAALDYMNGKFPVFHGHEGNDAGWFISDIPIKYLRSNCLAFSVNTLATRREVLDWYLELNEGLVSHQPAELARVKELRNLL